MRAGCPSLSPIVSSQARAYDLALDRDLHACGIVDNGAFDLLDMAYWYDSAAPVGWVEQRLAGLSLFDSVTWSQVEVADRAEFEQWVEKHSPALLSKCSWSSRQLSIVEDIKQASASLASATNNSTLAEAVRRHFPNATVFPIDWMPEQAEDIHWLLISPTEVAQITVNREPARAGAEVVVEMIALQTYSKRQLTKPVRRKLNGALELLMPR